ncbi:hypothetical protein TRFO_15726 [Tritrichomonas foetus]|uniref:Uncharacterized protein n=1 Tax=Tritrichomonas foetus TaxID=1144522 RepID=A0A1J4KRR0_9EUKA|nr:hypothetical protein TRFO_15726 [Tritrichomonas foetus]|eukprot:OHT13959.1 hypothetical protein TRFO_15726 [Tritrichomonas foetus]
MKQIKKEITQKGCSYHKIGEFITSFNTFISKYKDKQESRLAWKNKAKKKSLKYLDLLNQVILNNPENLDKYIISLPPLFRNLLRPYNDSELRNESIKTFFIFVSSILKSSNTSSSFTTTAKNSLDSIMKILFVNLSDAAKSEGIDDLKQLKFGNRGEYSATVIINQVEMLLQNIPDESDFEIQNKWWDLVFNQVIPCISPNGASLLSSCSFKCVEILMKYFKINKHHIFKLASKENIFIIINGISMLKNTAHLDPERKFIMKFYRSIFPVTYLQINNGEKREIFKLKSFALDMREMFSKDWGGPISLAYYNAETQTICGKVFREILGTVPKEKQNGMLLTIFEPFVETISCVINNFFNYVQSRNLEMISKTQPTLFSHILRFRAMVKIAMENIEEKKMFDNFLGFLLTKQPKELYPFYVHLYIIIWYDQKQLNETEASNFLNNMISMYKSSGHKNMIEITRVFAHIAAIISVALSENLLQITSPNVKSYTTNATVYLHKELIVEALRSIRKVGPNVKFFFFLIDGIGWTHETASTFIFNLIEAADSAVGHVIAATIVDTLQTIIKKEANVKPDFIINNLIPHFMSSCIKSIQIKQTADMLVCLPVMLRMVKNAHSIGQMNKSMSFDWFQLLAKSIAFQWFQGEDSIHVEDFVPIPNDEFINKYKYNVVEESITAIAESVLNGYDYSFGLIPFAALASENLKYENMPISRAVTICTFFVNTAIITGDKSFTEIPLSIRNFLPTQNLVDQLVLIYGKGIRSHMTKMIRSALSARITEHQSCVGIENPFFLLFYDELSSNKKEFDREVLETMSFIIQNIEFCSIEFFKMLKHLAIHTNLLKEKTPKLLYDIFQKADEMKLMKDLPDNKYYAMMQLVTDILIKYGQKDEYFMKYLSLLAIRKSETDSLTTEFMEFFIANYQKISGCVKFQLSPNLLLYEKCNSLIAFALHKSKFAVQLSSKLGSSNYMLTYKNNNNMEIPVQQPRKLCSDKTLIDLSLFETFAGTPSSSLFVDLIAGVRKEKIYASLPSNDHRNIFEKAFLRQQRKQLFVTIMYNKNGQSKFEEIINNDYSCVSREFQQLLISLGSYVTTTIPSPDQPSNQITDHNGKQSYEECPMIHYFDDFFVINYLILPKMPQNKRQVYSTNNKIVVLWCESQEKIELENEEKLEGVEIIITIKTHGNKMAIISAQKINWPTSVNEVNVEKDKKHLSLPIEHAFYAFFTPLIVPYRLVMFVLKTIITLTCDSIHNIALSNTIEESITEHREKFNNSSCIFDYSSC